MDDLLVWEKIIMKNRGKFLIFLHKYRYLAVILAVVTAIALYFGFMVNPEQMETVGVKDTDISEKDISAVADAQKTDEVAADAQKTDEAAADSESESGDINHINYHALDIAGIAATYEDDQYSYDEIQGIVGDAEVCGGAARIYIGEAENYTDESGKRNESSNNSTAAQSGSSNNNTTAENQNNTGNANNGAQNASTSTGSSNKNYIYYCGHNSRIKDQDKFDAAFAVAQDIAAQCQEGTVYERIVAACHMVYLHCKECQYSEQIEDYNNAYGVFIKKVYSCAGSSRAMGMVLDCMGFTDWEHVNEGLYEHQYLIMHYDGVEYILDAMISGTGSSNPDDYNYGNSSANDNSEPGTDANSNTDVSAGDDTGNNTDASAGDDTGNNADASASDDTGNNADASASDDTGNNADASAGDDAGNNADASASDDIGNNANADWQDNFDENSADENSSGQTDDQNNVSPFEDYLIIVY